MKKTVGILTLLLASASLVACGNTKKEVHETKEVSTTVTKNNQAKSSSSSVAKESGAKPSAAVDTSSREAVKDDDDYGKITTLKTYTVNKDEKHGDISANISDVKVLQYETKNKDQREFADFEDVPETYYVIEMDMTLVNNSSDKQLLQGISTMAVNKEELEQVNEYEKPDAPNSGDGELSLKPGISKKVKFSGLLTAEQVNNLKNLTFTFGEVNADNDDADTLTEEGDPITINLN